MGNAADRSPASSSSESSDSEREALPQPVRNENVQAYHPFSLSDTTSSDNANLSRPAGTQRGSTETPADARYGRLPSAGNLGSYSASSHPSALSREAYAQQVDQLNNNDRGGLFRFLDFMNTRRQTTLSSSAPQLFPRGTSPLLLASDAGLGGLVQLLFSGGSEEQVALRTLQRKSASNGARRRPRVLVNLTEGIIPRSADRFGGRRRRFDKKQERNSDDLKCPICLDIFDDPVVTPCRHIFCVDCMVSSLVRQSVCPLCRGVVYAHTLRPLNTMEEDSHLSSVYKRLMHLPVECPRCEWTGEMRDWPHHAAIPNCRRERRTSGPHACSRSIDAVQKKVTIVKEKAVTMEGESAKKLSQPERRISAENLAVGPNLPPTDAGTVTSPTEELACWLLDNNPGIAVKLHAIAHRMENPMGAVGGILYHGIYHAQAVLEFDSPLEEDRAEAHQTLESSELLEDAPTKTFVSMEIFSNCAGVEWKVTHVFPSLKPTAREIMTYTCTSPVGTEVIVDFLLSCRTRQYSLIQWNCQKFIVGLRKAIGVPDAPVRVQWLPRPRTYSAVLVEFLREVQRLGDLPTVSPVGDTGPLTAELSASSSSSPSKTLEDRCCASQPVRRKWISHLHTFIHRETVHKRSSKEAESSSSSSSSSRHIASGEATTSTGSSSSTLQLPVLAADRSAQQQGFEIRIRSATLCLFPAEDLNRASLKYVSALSLGNGSPFFCGQYGTLSYCRSAGRLRGLLTRALRRQPASSFLGGAESDPGGTGAQNSAVTDPMSSSTAMREAAGSLQQADEEFYALSGVEQHDDAQICLQYQTLPILIFELQRKEVNDGSPPSASCDGAVWRQKRSRTCAGTKEAKHPPPFPFCGHDNNTPWEKWSTIGYLSLEFRSDCGLVWHVYREIPPGLQVPGSIGGTDVVLSCSQTPFGLDVLIACLESMSDKEYHPLEWSGWDFARVVLESCCPAVAPHLLRVPAAEKLELL